MMGLEWKFPWRNKDVGHAATQLLRGSLQIHPFDKIRSRCFTGDSIANRADYSYPAEMRASSPRLVYLQPPSKFVFLSSPTTLQTVAASAECQEELPFLKTVKLTLKNDADNAFGLSGNKVRKLQFILHHAKSRGFDTVITCGAEQSNHARATALASRLVGLRCELLLKFSAPPQSINGNLMMSLLCGVRVHRCTSMEYTERRTQIMNTIAQRLQANDQRSCFIIPEGGSTPLGCWGYIDMMAELMDQCQQPLCTTVDGLRTGSLPFTHLIVTVGSAGTLAGILIGRALLGLNHLQIVGVTVNSSTRWCHEQVESLVAQFNASFHHNVVVPRESYHIAEAHSNGMHAVSHEDALQCVSSFARGTGVLLDPIYTAKTMCTLQRMVREGFFGTGFVTKPHLLFVHTGGASCMFADDISKQISEELQLSQQITDSPTA